MLAGLAQVLGVVFAHHPPTLISEILAGIVWGAGVLGHFSAVSSFVSQAKHQGGVLDFIYWLGLLLLMFLSGAETQQLLIREEQREVGCSAIVGSGIPFLLALGSGTRLIGRTSLSRIATEFP